jgi:uncharacterized delta-60 repeat protein
MRTRTIKMRWIQLAILCILQINGVFSQIGELDFSFSGDGKLLIDFAGEEDRALDTKVRPDGRIVAGGWTLDDTTYNFAFCQLLSDGSLDPGFGNNGITTFDINGYDDRIYALDLLTDGSLLAVGQVSDSVSGHAACFKLTPLGAPEISFASNGLLEIPFGLTIGESIARDIIILPDGGFFICGEVHNGSNIDYFVCRFRPDGLLDLTWSDDGIWTYDIGLNDFGHSIALLSDGTLILAGSTFYELNLFALMENGTLNSSFGVNGIVSVPNVSNQSISIACDNLDNIFVAAGVNNNFGIYGFLSNGNPLTSFGINGFKVFNPLNTLDVVEDIIVETDGKLLVCGATFAFTTSDFSIIKLLQSGSLDSQFSFDGFTMTEFNGFNDRSYSLSLQTDGKIVAGGESWNGNDYDFAFSRYDNSEPIQNIEEEIANPLWISFDPNKDEYLISGLNLNESKVELFDINGRNLSNFLQKNGNRFKVTCGDGYYLIKVTQTGNETTALIQVN